MRFWMAKITNALIGQNLICHDDFIFLENCGETYHHFPPFFFIIFPFLQTDDEYIMDLEAIGYNV